MPAPLASRSLSPPSGRGRAAFHPPERRWPSGLAPLPAGDVLLDCDVPARSADQDVDAGAADQPVAPGAAVEAVVAAAAG